MIYYRFQLDTSTEENMKKINPTKATALEKILRDKKFIIISSSTGTNGARDSLLVGMGTPSTSHILDRIKEIISKVDLPYVCKQSYS